MTVKEFYDWAKENKVENREILIDYALDGFIPFDADCDITITDKGLVIM